MFIYIYIYVYIYTNVYITRIILCIHEIIRGLLSPEVVRAQYVMFQIIGDACFSLPHCRSSFIKDAVRLQPLATRPGSAFQFEGSFGASQRFCISWCSLLASRNA